MNIAILRSALLLGHHLRSHRIAHVLSNLLLLVLHAVPSSRDSHFCFHRPWHWLLCHHRWQVDISICWHVVAWLHLHLGATVNAGSWPLDTCCNVHSDDTRWRLREAGHNALNLRQRLCMLRLRVHWCIGGVSVVVARVLWAVAVNVVVVTFSFATALIRWLVVSRPCALRLTNPYTSR